MSQSVQYPVITIMGPTASGKTDLAMELADRINGQLISVDSALIYKDMDIGTAKPTAEELARHPHQLISFLDPLETYSAADFCRDALKEIESAYQNGKTPILVGGTMMYYKSLIDGISTLPVAQAETRAEIEQLASKIGWEGVHQKLAEIDPESALRIHPNDPQRINRAYEIYLISGETMTALMKKEKKPIPFKVKQFAFMCEDKTLLHHRIEQRFLNMVEQGFEQEVRSLYERGDLHLDLPSMRCVGYRQMWEYFDGKHDWDEMIFRGVVATRQLAKRQLTWLRSWPDVTHLSIGKEKENLHRMINSLSL
ncbi:tRNA (adenosine(37)-N6)-dimethylallyltransferase MiaA [Psychrosphaera sp. B3R10]|uniref:tRNA (adenosine(37)-N6)-dimethylallyltransferase MiaA n=1 Tax=unclassified Psychrosphaera TaxID=2641570 RepID=UPI001C08EB50|nr:MULTISPECIES: tRNA (adenosine(37)-N6)-dimethylallyltransferase MiaA [unclassified Psychrosphaera]MBU2882685.1 tRNA (adenosine(37)-N6)-dimethylallyltransferase MiaA [Psychrosphaera sp. I2R16]MBU2989296.1 tRNA (adenosine(37)-N6)-dimethylallyltransferase MiaA [Psychrosphaera sp. B3R10]